MSLRQRLLNIVNAVLDQLPRWVAPAMPWLFLALRRALVATLVAAIVAVLFFVVPQSREVLHGFGEPLLESLQDFNPSTAKLFNVWAYASFVAAALALGFATWYAARLLVTVEAGLATPVALAEGEAAKRLAAATVCLPRGLGVFVLGAAVGALLYASCTPALRQAWALGVVALALAGPLGFVAGKLRDSRALRWGGCLLILISAGLLWRWSGPWRLALANTLAALLPAALLWFLIRRRAVLERMRWGTAQPAGQQRRIGEVIVTLFRLVLGSIGLSLVLAFSPTAGARIFGSAAAVLLFLVAAVLFLAGAHIVVRHVARAVPGLTLAGGVLFVLGVALLGRESLGDERLDGVASSLRSDASATVAAAAAVAAPASAPVRRVFVNAHGGGLRAATFTAQVLARADDASCGRFGEQVAAFSGVSGGSLGLATYLIARQEIVHSNAWAACPVDAKAPRTPLTDIVVRALVQDHLSPAVARLLAVDAPHLPGSPMRGQALLDSWQSALQASLKTALEGAAQPGTDAPPAAFAQRLGALTGGLNPAAVVYFNATDADSGQIVWFSNHDGGRVRTSLNVTPSVVPDLSVGQAVLHSARFPFVSPAGRLGSQRLVDGGYADNSGATTLREVFEEAQSKSAVAQPWLINIDGNPPDQSDCTAPADNPPIVTALRALLQARGAHALAAVEQFKQEKGIKPIGDEKVGNAIDVNLDFEKTLTDPNPEERCAQVRRAHQAPLGWYMSYSAARTIAASVDVGARSICSRLGLVCVFADPAVPGQR